MSEHFASWADAGIVLPPDTTGEIGIPCPHCSAERKKQNKPDLKVNVEKRTWFCHHCGWAGRLTAARDSGRFGTRGNGKARISLTDLAAHKRLTAAMLSEQFGLHDLPGGGVGIPYRDASGRTIYVKKRMAVRAGDGSFVPKGQKQMPYGLERLTAARDSGQLILVEGESDVWTLVHHGYEWCLGIPGALATKTLQPFVLQGIHTVYAVQETDPAGAEFIAGIRERLTAMRFPGQFAVIRLDAKDANDLHKRGQDGFRAAFEKALKESERGPEKAQDARSEPGPGEDTPEDAGFRFTPLSELLRKVHGTDYLVKPYLELDTLVMLFGESMAYKSFIALDLALCIAQGLPFHGHPTKRGAVFYIVGEGARGIAKRVLAWRIARGIKPDVDAPFFVSEVPAQLMLAENAAAIRAAVEALARIHGQPALIVIDTTAANMGPGDENKNSDVSLLLANINRELRAPFGACVLLVHHVGWGEKGRTRGAYAFFGNSDAQMLAERCPDPTRRIVTLTCKKTKDAPMWDPVSFEARIVELGIEDSGGALEASLALAEVDYVQPAPDEVTTTQQSVAMGILWRQYREHQARIEEQDLPGPSRVALRDWQDACIDHGLFRVRGDVKDPHRQKTRAFYRLRDRLKDKGLIAVDAMYVFPLR